MLAARRGLSTEELRLATPEFAAAVRWTLYVEKAGADLAELRQVVALDPPDSLTGADRIRFITNRSKAREALAAREANIFPPDVIRG